MNVRNTKSYRLFAALNSQERKDFVRFLRRHSRPKRDTLRASVRFLALQDSRISLDQVTNEEWWEAVFPGEQFSAPLMRKHQNKLVADMEEFLVDQKLRKEPEPYLARVRECEQLILLLGALHARGLHGLFASYLKRAEALVEELPQDHDREALRFQLALLKIDSKQVSSPFKPRQEYMDAQTALDNYYVVNALKLEVANRNHQRLQPQQPALGRIQNVLPVFAEAGGDIARAYERLLYLDAGIEEPDLMALVEDLVRCQLEFAPEVWKDMLYICMNLAIRRINEGRENFRLPVLRIYMVLLHAGLLQRDVSAFRLNFVNIVKLAFFRDPPEDLSRYVREQRALIEGDAEFGNAVQFFRCLEHFSQREFKRCNSCFAKVWLLEGGRQVRYAAGVARLKSLYESAEFDQLHDFSTEFKRQVLHDRNLSESRREAFLRFLKALHALCKVKFQGLGSGTRRLLKQLRTELETDKGMVSHTWLMEKIDAWP